MKKKIIGLFLVLAAAAPVFAQSQIGTTQPKKELTVNTYNKKEFFIGLGLGINAPTGMLGLKLGVIKNKFGAELGAGLSTWGYRQTLNIFYHQEKRNPWCPGIGFSRGTGIDNLELEVDAINKKTNLKETVTIPVVLPSCVAFNVFVQKNIYSKNGSRFALDLGLSFLLSSLDSKNIKSLNSNYELTKTTVTGLRALAPGGLTIGASYNFGL